MTTTLERRKYNLRTRELMRKEDGCRVTVVDDILTVGIGSPDIHDIVIIDHPSRTGGNVQKIGRAGRDHALVPNLCGIIYNTSYAMKLAHEQPEEKGGGLQYRLRWDRARGGIEPERFRNDT